MSMGENIVDAIVYDLRMRRNFRHAWDEQSTEQEKHTRTIWATWIDSAISANANDNEVDDAEDN